MRGKRGLILVNAYAPTLRSRQVERLTAELCALGANIDVRRNDFFAARIENSETTLETDCDFCVYLDKDKYVSHMLERGGVRLFNRARAIEDCDDKMRTHMLLADSGIPMPTTLPGLLCYDKSAAMSVTALEKVEHLLGYPLIVKQSYGSLGNGVFLAHDRAELFSIAESVMPEPHLFQKYIEKSRGKDMRVIVIGGNVIGAIIRESDTDFRANVGRGAKARKAAVPSEVAMFAQAAAARLGLDYCGIDFLLGDTPLLCEVNSNAYFDAFEAATGINVARLYAEHIIDEIGK